MLESELPADATDSAAVEAELAFKPLKDDFTGYLFGNNPITVASNSRFTIQLTHVNPGYISVKRNEKARGEPYKAPSIEQPHFDAATVKQVKDSDLFIVTRIESRSHLDPLAQDAKVIVKTSYVKQDASSFSLIPLNYEESRIFTQEANSAWWVTIRVFRVFDFQAKREALWAQRNSPGISKLLVNLWDTTSQTFQAVVGDTLVARLDKEVAANPTAVEQMLLMMGGRVEFQGSFSILVGDTKLSPDQPKPPRYFMLYDYFKSLEDSSGSLVGKDREEWKAHYETLAALEVKNDGTKASGGSEFPAFIRFTVREELALNSDEAVLHKAREILGQKVEGTAVEDLTLKKLQDLLKEQAESEPDEQIGSEPWFELFRLPAD